MLGTIKRSAAYIKPFLKDTPRAGIILGSGLGGFVDEIEILHTIPYCDIPHFTTSKVEGHQGNLIVGYYSGHTLLIMQGRIHYYEGHTIEVVTFPIRVMKELGIEVLMLSNASGGMNPDFRVGDLMIINDHINMMPNPLVGPNIDELGPRFPDMSEPYDQLLMKKALEIAQSEQINIHQGCYVAVTGPTYETPAEYKYFRIIGGDAVGMSTVPEVIVARHMGLRCFAISVITDLGIPGEIEYITHDMVQQAAEAAEPKLATIIKQLIKGLD